MNAIKWVAAGAIGGLIGAFIWGSIAYFAQAEIGWIAWGIGALVGICVRYAAGEESEGPLPGSVAVGLSAFSIAVGKYLAAVMILGGLSVEFHAEPATPEDAKLELVNLVNDEYADWSEVPAEEKQPIETRWKAMSEAEQQQFLNEMSNRHAKITANELFQESFSPYDLLWFGLAALTAYRLGSGTAKDD